MIQIQSIRGILFKGITSKARSYTQDVDSIIQVLIYLPLVVSAKTTPTLLCIQSQGLHLRSNPFQSFILAPRDLWSISTQLLPTHSFYLWWPFSFSLGYLRECLCPLDSTQNSFPNLHSIDDYLILLPSIPCCLFLECHFLPSIQSHPFIYQVVVWCIMSPPPSLSEWVISTSPLFLPRIPFPLSQSTRGKGIIPSSTHVSHSTTFNVR